MEEFYKTHVIKLSCSVVSKQMEEFMWAMYVLSMYGILALKKNYQVSSLSMDDIEQSVDDLIQEDARKTKKNLKKFDIGHKLQSDVYIISNVNNRPSSSWGKGDIRCNVNNNESDKQQQQSH